ncbi:hypothetical protein DQ164_15065, partial [Enterococcus faecalis]|nr:hypothetical protein [Enterococcus faecalis]
LFIINNIFIYIITIAKPYFLFFVKNDLIYALYVYFSFFENDLNVILKVFYTKICEFTFYYYQYFCI